MPELISRILGGLKRKRLLAIAEAHDVTLTQRRSIEPIREELANALKIDVVLGELSKDELQQACRELNISDKSAKKADLVSRIMTAGASEAEMPLFSAKNQQNDQKQPEKSVKTAKKRSKKATKDSKNSNSLGFEDDLWKAANVLRSNMDPAEYKHIVLGLIFLKYLSDAFEERQEAIRQQFSDPESEDYVADEAERAEEIAEMLEDRDEYTAFNVYWVPEESRWSTLQASAQQATIAKLLDDAMIALEKDNDQLQGALFKGFARSPLSRDNLAKLIDLIGGIGLGSQEHRDKDTLGRVYEYFLSKFASAEGRGGGEFFTPTSIVRVLVEMLQPFEGKVYDPCCGSGGMFVQSHKFIAAHGGQRKQIAVYGQESNRTTWRLARMNLAIRGIEANLGDKHADSFHNDLHADLKADFIMANPPFNISDWGGEKLVDDKRWKYGTPPKGNANYAWLQHMIHHLSPNGTAGVVLANGSMSSMQSGEGDIRQKLIEADLVDCIVAMPGQLFYATGIPVCLWFLAKNKKAPGFRDRSGEILFIDARELGTLETRVHRILSDEEVARIADTYHAWRDVDGKYEDEPGFCKSAQSKEVTSHDAVLTPGRYVGAEDHSDDGEPINEKMDRLTTMLFRQFTEANRLEKLVRKELGDIGYGL